MTRPIPQVAKNNLRVANLGIKAIHPGATDIDFIDELATTPQHWSMFQFKHKGRYGVATLGALSPEDGIRTEHPYSPTLWRYNTPQ